MQESNKHHSYFNCHICQKSTAKQIKKNWKFKKSISSDHNLIKKNFIIGICENCGSVVKDISSEWQKETNLIYENFSMYTSSGGNEKTIFNHDTKKQTPRSEFILSSLKDKFDLTSKLKILDIGAGNGVFLKSASTILPFASLYAQDISNIFQKEVELITNFKKFFQGSLDHIKDKFDLIAMIHVLEHIENPIMFLKNVKKLLSLNGMLLLNVPNSKLIPIDLCVFDHCTHFDIYTLTKLLNRADWKIEFISDSLINGEIVALLKPGVSRVGIKNSQNFLLNNLNYLDSMVDAAINLRKNKEINIFGSSLASIWLAGQLSDWAGCYVDEDENKNNTKINGRSVLKPSSLPNDSNVFIPLEKNIAKDISKRLSTSVINYYFVN